MDFNSVQTKVKQLYVALDATKDFKPAISMRQRTEDLSATMKRTTFTFSFGSSTEDEKYAKLKWLISSIGELKDIMKNRMKKLKMEPKDVEVLINGSHELSIVIDLWNQYKHGTPLKRPPRTGMTLALINPTEALQVTEKGVSFLPFQQQFRGEVPNTIIDADVVEESNPSNMLGKAGDICSKAIEEIEAFVSKNKL